MYNNMAEYLTTNLSVELDGINKAFNRCADKQLNTNDYYHIIIYFNYIIF